MDYYCPLPEDLVVDILLMLPVEPLLRFKCVCKHWYALIKSESFIEKHFHHKNNRSRLLICNLKFEEEEHTLFRSAVVSLLPEKIVPGVTPEKKILLHLPRVDYFKCVAGPVNGLFLVQEIFCGYGDHLSLWNPATREFRPLPPAPFVTEHFLCNYDHEFGLGFDQLTQDYKVVWIRVFFDNRGQGQGQGSYLHNSVCVYSSCDNSWKNLQFPSSFTLEAAHLPRGIWENDKIVFDLTETSQLVLYDPTTSQVTDLGIQLKLIGCCVFNYQESLALITKGNESQDEDNTDRANEVVQLLGGRMMSRIENQFPPSDLSFSE
ncbi:hypothetical protein KY290_021976 [Solanum tuberosum]|uniref:F-box domain-containing protein n=1 Tax=Solanum tuberosum TaxID=4113 RepID=A0ABQ7V535_SOLTU|nr:hypothetical protein KY290_021976 [Solanum tuberosum]